MCIFSGASLVFLVGFCCILYWFKIYFYRGLLGCVSENALVVFFACVFIGALVAFLVGL